MKFFTPQRYLALQTSDENALDVAEDEWDRAVDAYAARLGNIRSTLPQTVQSLVDDYYLHDAVVLSMGNQGNEFVIVLQLDPPPNDLLTITYNLVDTPQVIYDAFPNDQQAARPTWLYDEFEVENGSSITHSVLLSNGWELQIPFQTLNTATATPMFPRATSA